MRAIRKQRQSSPSQGRWLIALAGALRCGIRWPFACVLLGVLVAGGASAAEKADPALKRLAKAMGPEDGILKGKVLSQETGELLPAASIYVLDPTTSALVKGGPGSLDGEYELVVPAGTYTVKVSYIA